MSRTGRARGALSCALLLAAGVAGIPRAPLGGSGAEAGPPLRAPAAPLAAGASPGRALPGPLFVVGAALAPRIDDGTQEAVRAALAEAAAARREAQKLEGAEREQALASVTARYAAIAENDGMPSAGRAEAAYRAGELLRGSKVLDEAEVMFRRATDLGAAVEDGQEFAARGLLERAHLKRRARDAEGALQLYAEVVERFSAERRSAAHAVTWSGKLQLQLGRREEGLAALIGFAAQFPEYPAEAVRNADLAALEQVEAGDEAGARATLAGIQAAMESVTKEGGKQAEQVAKALAAMRVTEQLAGY